MQSVNPATGLPLAQYPEHTTESVQAALARAAQCFATYRYAPIPERAQWMMQAAELLRTRSRKYATLMTLEMGKTIASAEAEVEKCAWACEYYAANAEKFLARQPVLTDASSSFVDFQPLGAVLAVMPWNFPFWQVFRFAAPALMAGNVCLLKHASNVPGSALAIQEVFTDAGFPQGCFTTLLVGAASVAGLIADPRIAAVTLTGSEPAGASVGSAAGHNLKKVVLELGGSDPFIVMPSADIDAAVNTAVAARMVNNGQSCIAAKRFIVHRQVLDVFQQRMAGAFRALRLGDPLDPDTQVGPMARAEFARELLAQVQQSVALGARVLAGGAIAEGPGYFFQPTVLTDVRKGMPVYHQETFGPVAAIICVDDINQAILTANDTRFGLGASAWTNDHTERQRFIAEIESGSVFINSMVKSDPRLPFGGIKASGIGRELADFGIREFVNVKTVWID